MRFFSKHLLILTLAILLVSILIYSCGKNDIQTRKIYLQPGDTFLNYYKAIIPRKRPEAFLFLIPGYGETPESMLLQTTLPFKAASKGILTIIPQLGDGPYSFGIDSFSQLTLENLVSHIDSIYQLKGNPIFFGGFSLGGSCAIKYAQGSIRNNSCIRPTAIFAIDPPLDFERVYNASKRLIRLHHAKGPVDEARLLIEKLEQHMPGDPATSITNYHKLSPYSQSDTNQSAIRCLQQLPLRIYAEPDINWWTNERGQDLSNMNVLDASRFINELRLLGNRRAQLVLTQNRGFRHPNHARHPHSWSIVDDAELLNWLMNQK